MSVKRVGETVIETGFILQNLKKLGYKTISGNVIGQNLIYKDDFFKMIKSPVNKKAFDYLLKKHFNSEEELLNAVLELAECKMLTYQNTAFLLRKGLKIHGKKLILFVPKNNSLGYNKDFELNNFTAANQFHCDMRFKKINKRFSRKPDIIFFVNGIYYSQLELKYANRSGQTARKEGRKQIIVDNYQSLFVNHISPEMEHYDGEYDNDKEKYKRHFSKLYEKAVHCVTMDMTETYVHRFIKDLRTDVEKIFCNKNSNLNFEESGFKEFRILPQDPKIQNIVLKAKNSLEQLYSFDNVNNEVLYYNIGDGARLKAPRPNQKHGVDKVMNHVNDLYLGKNIKNKDLDDLPPLLKESIEYQQNKFLNNKDVFSVLLQYSAGFGKSLIISWLALRLKDFYIEDEAVFNKILIVADRLDLKDQMADTMREMNIEKSMIAEIESAAQLKKALSNNGAKIIIVNIQKFKDEDGLKKIFNQDVLNDLKKSKYAFLIDEIHRSNAGSQHGNMTDLFSDLYDKLDTKDINDTNKNLIIGLTATPSDSILARFGEYDSYQGANILWKPFDSFTMNQAIADGFVLDPTEFLLTIDIEPEIGAKDKKLLDEGKKKFAPISDKQFYEHPERSKILAKYIVDISTQKTFNAIRGRGKSMVASYSIYSAIQLYNNIKDEVDRYLVENPDNTLNMDKFELSIVFTSNGSVDQTVKTMNNGRNEKQVIKDFKSCKNGIIVVVDKLQTGFDVKELNALFLDKPIRGINAVQTLCRINRIAPNKNECYAFDFSRDNINKSNILSAFETYSDIKYSGLDPINHEKKIIDLYKAIQKDSLYKSMRKIWLNIQKSKTPVDKAAYSIELQNQALAYKKHSKVRLDNFLNIAGEYLLRIAIIKDILDIDNDYIIKDFYEIVKEIRNSVYDNPDDIKLPDITLVFEDDNHSIVKIEEELKDLGSELEIRSKKVLGNSNDLDGIAKLLIQISQLEENQALVTKYKLLIENCVLDLINYDIKNHRSRIINEVKKTDGSFENINSWFGQEYGKVSRRVWGRNSDIDSEILELLEQIRGELLTLMKAKILDEY